MNRRELILFPKRKKIGFYLKCLVDYPSAANEMEILNRMSQSQKPTVRPVWSAESLRAVQNHIHSIYLDEKIKKYIIDLVMATRKAKGIWSSGIGGFD